MPVGDPAHHELSWLADGSCGNFDQHVVEPQKLGINEIDAVLFGVRVALVGVESELHSACS